MNPRVFLFLLVFGGYTAGCGKPPSKPQEAAAPAAEALTQTNESGPVKATVTLSPKKPRLGDQLSLTLTVEAQRGVTVEMPPFGDALGRFSIASFVPRTERSPDGKSKHSQRYVLEVPMSGRQRIPALRIEFTDDRAEAKTDGGASSVHELLTDEIPIDIASVLSEPEQNGELRELRGPLDESVGRTRWLPFGLALLGLAGALGVYFFVSRLRARARLQLRKSAYDVAMQRLHKLKERGFPRAEDADPFYVELSAIVRRYIEDRYGVRAPELTTEEFLREARSRLQLSQAQRERLEAFLAACDRVKFAGYRPGVSESQMAFEDASHFLADTRLAAAPRQREVQP